MDLSQSNALGSNSSLCQFIFQPPPDLLSLRIYFRFPDFVLAEGVSFGDSVHSICLSLLITFIQRRKRY